MSRGLSVSVPSSAPLGTLSLLLLQLDTRAATVTPGLEPSTVVISSVRREVALLFPSCTSINVSNVRRLSQSTVVVVVHGRRPPPSPLTKASALDTLPENDQAHSPAVQLITPVRQPYVFFDVAATTLVFVVFVYRLTRDVTRARVCIYNIIFNFY